MAGDSDDEVEGRSAGDPLAFVFKTIADPYVGQVSLFKVLSGTIRPDDHLFNTRTSGDERLHGLLTVRGKEQDDAQVEAGDIGAVAKLSSTETGDTLAPKGKPVGWSPDRAARAGLAVAIVPTTQADEDKLANAIHRLQEEDPALVIERNDETHQTLLKGVGETHLTITLEKLSASSASRSTPRRSGSPTGRPSPGRPRPRASTRSRPAATASSGCASSGRAARAGRRLRVRRQDRRRRHPPPVHPRGREGHRGDHVRGGRTAIPSSTCG